MYALRKTSSRQKSRGAKTFSAGAPARRAGRYGVA
jgi:hypothetical protein